MTACGIVTDEHWSFELDETQHPTVSCGRCVKVLAVENSGVINVDEESIYWMRSFGWGSD